MKLTKSGRVDKRYKSDEDVTVPKQETAQEKLQNFLRENSITLEYTVVETRFIEVSDGFILAPKNPMLKVSAKYDR